MESYDRLDLDSFNSPANVDYNVKEGFNGGEISFQGIKIWQMLFLSEDILVNLFIHCSRLLHPNSKCFEQMLQVPGVWSFDLHERWGKISDCCFQKLANHKFLLQNKLCLV